MMKTIMTITVAVAAVCAVALLMVCCSGKKPQVVDNPAPTGVLMSYEYAHYGTMAQPNHSYTLTANDDHATATLVVAGMSDVVMPAEDDPNYENILSGGDTVIVDVMTLQVVSRLIIDNKMQNYAASYDNPGVLDGYSWHYRATYDDGTVLTSGGSNSGPGDGGFEQINKILQTAYLLSKGIVPPTQD